MRPRPAPVETVVVRLRPSVRVLVWPTLALAALTAAVGYGAGRVPERWQANAMLLAALLLALVLWVLPLLRWLCTRYVLTTERMVVRTGILVRRRREVQLSRVDALDTRQTAVQALFRCGDVRLSAGGDVVLVLHDAPSPALIEAAVGDLGRDGE